MNKEKLKNIIEKYKQYISNNVDIEAINERKEIMIYYQRWTTEKIQSITEDEFVEFICKLWSMIVLENERYIADKIIKLNGFNKKKSI